RLPARPVLEDRVSRLGVQYPDQPVPDHACSGDWLLRGLPQVGADRAQRAGLSLQLGRPGGCEVLIRPDGQTTESPGIARGFFVARHGRPAARCGSLPELWVERVAHGGLDIMTLTLKPLHPVFAAEATGLDLSKPISRADACE